MAGGACVQEEEDALAGHPDNGGKKKWQVRSVVRHFDGIHLQPDKWRLMERFRRCPGGDGKSVFVCVADDR